MFSRSWIDNFVWYLKNTGFFGAKAEVPSNVYMNYAGVALAAISGVFYLFVQNEPNSSSPKERQPLLAAEANVNRSPAVADMETETAEDRLVNSLSPRVRKVIGVSLASVAGVLYAVTFTPALYVQDNYPVIFYFYKSPFFCFYPFLNFVEIIEKLKRVAHCVVYIFVRRFEKSGFHRQVNKR